MIVFEQAQQQAVHPSARQDGVEATHDNVELAVEVDAHVLDAFAVRGYLAVRHTLADELGGHLGFGSTNVALAEQELPVQVGHVDRVHINDVDVREAHVGEVLEQLTAQPARSHDQYLDLTQAV